MQRQAGPRRQRRWLIAALAVPVLAVPALAAASAQAAWGAPASRAVIAASAATNPATVSVNAAQSVATVPATGIGINGSVYDPNLKDAAVPGLLSGAGVKVIRFPGGSESDQYNWKTNTDVLSGAVQATSFDQYASLLSQAGAQGMVTVNYGTGDTVGATESPAETGAQLAADWVRYANVTHNYNIKYWEIGNEIYGNGTYGADWETDRHCASGSNPANCGPAVYAQNVKAYITAMKTVDPTIKIGVVLTAPGSWPDGVTSAGSPQSWNQTVLSALGSQIDFADVHWYPQNPSTVTPPGPTDAGLLGDTAQISGIVSTLRSQMGQYAGNANIPISVTETNSVSSNPGKQTVGIVNALYLAQDYLGWLQSGVTNVDWWQIHNNLVTTGDNESSLNGTASYGDYGVLSDATCGTIGSAQVCEPAADTPFPAYYGLKLLSQFIHPADTLVSATSSQSLVHAYAVKAADGSLRVLLVNDDPSNSYTVGLSYAGFTAASGAPSVATLTPPGTSITTAAAGSAASQTIAPYSAAMITLQPGSAGGGNTVTVTNPGSRAGTVGTAAILQITAGDSASGQTLSYSATGLPAGLSISSATGLISGTPTTAAAYTVTVTAKDTTGASGSASFTWTISSAGGGGSSCHVVYTTQSQWAGGFTANVTLTNTGTTARASWTAVFTYPGDQKVTSSWNTGTLTQAGETITAANASYNGTIAAGASTSFGMQGTWTSSDAAPTSFTVNGTACT
jgi:Cellulose binding domain/Putative Ig domain